MKGSDLLNDSRCTEGEESSQKPGSSLEETRSQKGALMKPYQAGGGREVQMSRGGGSGGEGVRKRRKDFVIRLHRGVRGGHLRFEPRVLQRELLQTVGLADRVENLVHHLGALRTERQLVTGGAGGGGGQSGTVPHCSSLCELLQR